MDNKDVTFSIIIPTYNHAHLINRCIDSLISQTYDNWEAIIVNNASTDNTVEVIESYNDSRVKYINFNNDQGIAASRNFGIKSSVGNFICFLDSDDWWREDKLEVCKKYIGEGYDFICHSLALAYSGKKGMTQREKIQVRDFSQTKNLTEDVLINGNFILNSSVVVSKELVDKTGELNEDLSLKAVEDLEYWIRVFKNKVKPKCIPTALGYYWIGNNTSTRLEQIDRYGSLFNKYVGELDSKEKIKEANKHKNYLGARIYHTNKVFAKAIKGYYESLSLKNISRSIKGVIGIVFCILKIKR